MIKMCFVCIYIYIYIYNIFLNIVDHCYIIKRFLLHWFDMLSIFLKVQILFYLWTYIFILYDITFVSLDEISHRISI